MPASRRAEGVSFGNYRWVELAVDPLAPCDDAPSSAMSLASERRDPSLLPSTRSMALVIAGAAEHGLPAEYLEALRATPAREQTAVARALRPLVDSAMQRRR